MKVKILNDEVHIESTGIELIKLKTELTIRLDELLKFKKNLLIFPVSSLPLVQDLIDDNNVDDKTLSILNLYSKHEIARVQSLLSIENQDSSNLTPYWISILEPAQASAVNAMVIPNLLGLCLFDEQGSGKTVMTISAFDLLKERDEVDAMIIICPKTMVSEWPKDINRFLSSKYKIEIAEGNQQQKYQSSLKDFDVMVTNYEGIKPMLVNLNASAETRRYLLVIDESFNVKNSESLRAEMAEKLRSKCKRCFVLCGTPAPNTAHDLVNQFDLADIGYTFAGFKKSKKAEDDWERIASLVDERGVYIRRLKDEILSHVPEKNFHVIRVELVGKQALMYEAAKTQLQLHLRNLNNETFKKSLVTYFQKRAVLLQICACPLAVDPTISEVPAKYIKLDELLEKLISQGRKVVLWSFYKKSLDEMYVRYNKYNPVRVDGSISSAIRKDAVRSFQEDTSVMLFIGNPSAAGAGITLHAAYDAVYISYSNQAAHYLQSLDRIHRRGQVSDEVNYYLLICKDTIEETEIQRLRAKEIRQHELLGDQITWPATLDDALSELGSYD